MATRIEEVMSKNVVTVQSGDSLRKVAECMRDSGIGDVLVLDENRRLVGIVTDRDIVVRGLAAGADPESPVGRVCSRELQTLAPDDSVEKAVDTMRKNAIRRIPVVKGETPVGILSIGDLAQARDPKSALGQISAAPPNL